MGIITKIPSLLKWCGCWIFKCLLVTIIKAIDVWDLDSVKYIKWTKVRKLSWLGNPHRRPSMLVGGMATTINVINYFALWGCLEQPFITNHYFGHARMYIFYHVMLACHIIIFIVVQLFVNLNGWYTKSFKI